MEVLEAEMGITIMDLAELVLIIAAVEEHLVLSLMERQDQVIQEDLFKIQDRHNKIIALELQQFQEPIHQDKTML